MLIRVDAGVGRQQYERSLRAKGGSFMVLPCILDCGTCATVSHCLCIQNHIDTLFVTFCCWIDALQRQVLERGRPEGNRQPSPGHTQSEPL